MLYRLVLLMQLALIGACSNLGYYLDSTSGHLDLMAGRQPVAKLLAGDELSPERRERLELAQRARDFASEELLLPNNDSYRTFVDLQRPYAIWNVIAAPRYSVQAKQWCFVFAGCITYRGYFDREDAERYGDKMRKQDLDVFVAGARAYSTLGWFNDPLLNTMLYRNDARLVGIIFHELAHQELYVKGDSAFNEAFATAVEREGVRRWFAQQGNGDSYVAFIEHQERDRAFKLMLIGAREQLARLYDSGASETQMQVGKQEIFAGLQRSYLEFKREWNDYDGFDEWMAQDLNNAHLALVATYHKYVPAFQRLLRDSDGDMREFYEAARAVGELDAESRRARMDALLAEQDQLS